MVGIEECTEIHFSPDLIWAEVDNAAPQFSLWLLFLGQSAFSTGGLLATLVPVSKHIKSLYWIHGWFMSMYDKNHYNIVK